MRLTDKVEDELLAFLMDQGYSVLVKIPNRGWCGIKRMLFTTGLFYNITFDSTGDGRYCFETRYEATAALIAWDGATDPPGDWIKHFGLSGEYINPNYTKK